jgi:hypothetical protein
MHLKALYVANFLRHSLEQTLLLRPGTSIQPSVVAGHWMALLSRSAIQLEIWLARWLAWSMPQTFQFYLWVLDSITAT